MIRVQALPAKPLPEGFDNLREDRKED